MKRGFGSLCLLLLLLGTVRTVWAIPTQYGDSGLLSQPTADTLNAGNICLGLWGNCSSDPDGDQAVILPAAITLGLGTFLEAYGSYPNILFNDEDRDSGRGYANIGMKARILGERSSAFKVSLDGQARRTIADEARFDGLTDFLTRGIASYKTDTFGIHANGGYSWNDNPSGQDGNDQFLYGGGIEFYPRARLRLMGEFEGASERIDGEDSPREVSAGLQYFFSPHLTLNLGGGIGLSDASPDWRFLFGLSACQGIGTYTRPVPKIVEPETAKAEQAEEKPAKVVKIKTLTPLIPRKSAQPEQPTSKLEVPVNETDEEEVILYPEENVPPPQEQAGGAVAPVGSVEPAWPEQVSGEPLTQPITGVVYRRFRVPGSAFEPDQWGLSAAGKQALAEVAEVLRTDEKWYIMRLEGHTDNLGSESYNQKLALRRALSCANHIITHHGIDPARLFVKGIGEGNPIAENATEEGRALNRRVEILVLVPGPETIK